MKKIYKIIIDLTVYYLIFFWSLILPYSSGPPSGYANNSPNNRNCTSCHSGVINSGNGSISLSGIPYSYSLGETYEIQVTVSGDNSRGYGFQVAAQSGNSSTGSLNTNSSSSGIEKNGNLIQHSTRGISGVWIFDWVAPSSDVGEITISASGLATGGSSGSGGDYTYTFSKTISKLSETLIISGDAGFRMLSPPVSNGTYSDLLAELWTQGMTGSDAPEASGDNVWTFALGSGAAGTWSAATNLGNTMTAGAGFLVYVFADNNYDGTDDLPKTLSVGGSENSGNVTYPASGSIDANQYGLSGNPYYTTIDWDDVTKNNVTGTVYVYNDAKSGGAGYINWNGSSGDLTGGLIAPFQGFWVQATGSGSGSIQIQTADKATSSGTFYRMLDTEEEGSMYFEFSSVDGGYDKVWFSFNNDGDKDKDTRDAYKLMPLMASSRLVAMSYADEHSLDINNLPFSNDTDIDAALDVMYLNLEESYYTSFSSEVTATWDISQLPDHIEMVLLDQVTGDVIHLDHMSSYSFSTEEEAGFSAVYDNAVASYPVSESPRFIVQLRYGALDSDLKESVPKSYSLSPVYPNPFNPSATVQFDIREWSRVQLDVYDIKGALVETLLDRKLTPGSHRYRWQPSSISAGVYFLRLTTPDEIFTQKVTYVK